MKRLIKKASSDYTQAVSYTQEKDLAWSNTFVYLDSLPQGLVEELTYALLNYSNDTAAYSGEHPLTICSRWQNQFSDQFNAQQMTDLTNMIIPAIKSIGL